MLKQTPLHAVHRAAGARMVDFGAVRRDAGMFDVSHMLAIDIEPRDAVRSQSEVRDFLRYALANNVDKLTVPGKALYSCLLRPDGGVLDDLIVYFLREDSFRVVVNAGTADKDLAWLGALAAERAPGIKLTPRRDLAMIAVQGPRARLGSAARSAVSDRIAEAVQCRPARRSADCPHRLHRRGRARDHATGDARGRALASAAGCRRQGLRPRRARLEAGMNLYGQDMDEAVNPLESGLAWTLDLKSPRDFVGKPPLLAAQASLQLAGLVLQEQGGILRAHQRVTSSQGDGEVTSGSYSPTLGRSIALARMPSRVVPGDIVHVDIRGKLLAARVVKPPFVRNGKSLID